jgi:hypothetical protein
MQSSANNKQFVTFDEQVRLICSYLGDDEAVKLYTKVARFLGLTLEDFNLKIIPNITSTLLPINENLTVDLPSDFQEISKVGVCCEGNRTIMLLGRNHDLCKSAFKDEPAIQCCTCDKSDDDDTSQDEDTCCPSCTFNNFRLHNSTYGSHYLFNYGGYLYGYQPTNQFTTGTYDIDYQNNRLILGDGCSVKIGEDLVVEYTPVLTGDGLRLIPRKARTAIMYKVAHLIRNHPSDLQSFKREYYELKRTYDSYTLKDWLAAIRGGYHSSIKR